MILDVNSPLEGGHLDRTNPQGTYNSTYFEQVYGIIEAFKNYPNTLGFFAGNEVINEESTKSVPAYIRVCKFHMVCRLCMLVLTYIPFQAVQRDMKDYIAKHSERAIPVGYSAADVREILMDTVNYMSCDLSNSSSSRSDFFGLNSYSWCGNSSYTTSGYDILTEKFSNATLPIFFSEFGCNVVRPRIFTEVEALYNENMSQAFSGGLVYEYSQQSNDYGLVKLDDNGAVTLLEDYDNLQKQYLKVDMDRVESLTYGQISAKPQKCTPSLIKTHGFLESFDLPERPVEVQEMIDHGFSNGTPGRLLPVKQPSFPDVVYDLNGNSVPGFKMQVLDSLTSNSPRRVVHAANSTGDELPAPGNDSSNESNASRIPVSFKLFLWAVGIALADIL